MKNLILCLFLLSGSFLLAQTNHEKEFQETIENFFQEVFSELDSTRLEKYVTKDFVLFEDGEIYNNDSVKIMIKNLIHQFSSEENKGKKLERINSFEFLGADSDQNSGRIYYRNFAEFKMDGTKIAQLHWLESANFIRTDEGWKIAFLHSTLVKDK